MNRFGIFGKALRFTDNIVELPIDILHGLTNLTITYWVKVIDRFTDS
jgi:hypothetical protein